MAERQPNEVKIISWYLVAKNLIKFADNESTFKLGDAVLKANNFEKWPLRKGDKVEVGIAEGVVTFLRKNKSESKSEGHGSEEAYEPTPEEEKPLVAPTPAPAPEVKKESPEIVGEMQTLTIFAVSVNKKVVKFTELKDAGWFQIDPSIQAKDYTEIGLIARNKCRVQLEENRVLSFEKVVVEAPETTQEASGATKTEPTAPSAPKKEWKPASQYNDEKQNSIECQAMINSACEVVGQVAASISPAPTANVINNMIRVIAESNYQLLQDLKKR